MSRHGADLVYIFHGDIERMKRNPGKKWDLYGLRTHSSCPVVQYICEEGSRSAGRLGLELLGQCVPARGSTSRNNRSSSRDEPWLEVRNNGVQLEAVLQQQQRSSGFRPAPARCSVKPLTGESPFSNVHSHSRSNLPPQHARTTDPPERRPPADRRGERATENQANNTHVQWYTTPRGEDTLRNIHNSCVSNFPAPSQVEMRRDVVDLSVQLSIAHNNKTFDIKFSTNYPQSPAHVSCTDAIYNSTRLLGQAASQEEIVRIIKNNCGCFACKR